MNLRVEIDHRTCLATGGCVGLAPDHFETGPDGKALIRCGGAVSPRGVLNGLSKEQSDGVREAAMFCAPEAISVWDADSGEQYFP